MKIKRFVAKDMRSALAQIKEELGVDAVIMSNKKVPEGVELMAAVDYNAPVKTSNKAGKHEPALSEEQIPEDIVSIGQGKQGNSASIQTGHQQAEHSSRTITETLMQSAQQTQETPPADSLTALLNRKIQPQQTSSGDNISEQLKDFTERLQQSTTDQIAESMRKVSAQESSVQATPDQNNISSPATSITQPQNDEILKLKEEMSSIRHLLEHQVSGLMWQDMAQKDPMRALLVDKLMVMGMSETVADRFAGYIPHNLSDSDAWDSTLTLLEQQIHTTNNDILQRGGVLALVGPTGVGKTTTIAKLAARYAQIHGAENVALISTDSFRIAGFEQLATYGRIIGCQVKQANDHEALAQYLQQFHQKKLILIDTAGMGQRDLRLVEHLSSLLANSRVKIRNYLVLAANTQLRVMQENVERFKKIPLAGCIYTKLDESLSVGEIISTSIQNGLPIGYLTDGQRVPEDIKVANAKKLVMLANKMSLNSIENMMKWQNNRTSSLANMI